MYNGLLQKHGFRTHQGQAPSLEQQVFTISCDSCTLTSSCCTSTSPSVNFEALRTCRATTATNMKIARRLDSYIRPLEKETQPIGYSTGSPFPAVINRIPPLSKGLKTQWRRRGCQTAITDDPERYQKDRETCFPVLLKAWLALLYRRTRLCCQLSELLVHLPARRDRHLPCATFISVCAKASKYEYLDTS